MSTKTVERDVTFKIRVTALACDFCGADARADVDALVEESFMRPAPANQTEQGLAEHEEQVRRRAFTVARILGSGLSVPAPPGWRTVQPVFMTENDHEQLIMCPACLPPAKASE